jgi:hypothetical protein
LRIFPGHASCPVVNVPVDGFLRRAERALYLFGGIVDAGVVVNVGVFVGLGQLFGLLGLGRLLAAGKLAWRLGTDFEDGDAAVFLANRGVASC